ncbi:2-amino-4-ketopentanoate thiolase [Thermovorax subterraneus]|nr:2-amino-4-ketopentanoate thiolase [Thermovorax subterraneus]
MPDALKGTWVQIHKVVLKPEERSARLPDDTKKVPLEFRLKGFLTHDANLGDEVEIETLIGRKVRGKLVKINPMYDHGFGRPVPELLSIGMELRKILGGEDSAS